MGALEPVVSAVGAVDFDPEHVATIGARLRGLVSRVVRFEGDVVEKGTLLAVIESPELGEAQASVTLLTVLCLIVSLWHPSVLIALLIVGGLTILGIRERTHWNAASLTPLDPVTLGLCSQIDLDFEVQRASKEKPAPAESGVTLLPAAVTTAPREEVEEKPVSKAQEKQKEDLDVNAVFAKLKQLGGKAEDKGGG